MYIFVATSEKKTINYLTVNLNEDAYCRVIPLGLKNMIHVIYRRN